MFFEREDFSATVLHAGEMCWEAGRHRVRPRPFHALALRLRGEGHFRFSEGKTLDTRCGEVLFLPAGCGYDVEYSAGEIAVFHFSAALTQPAPAVFRAESGGLTPLFSEAARVFAARQAGYRQKTTALFYEILFRLCRAADREENEHPGFAKAVARLTARRSDPTLRISEVCRQAYISESVFRRLFAARYGQSPVEYLTSLRLSDAESCLLLDGMTVGEAAESAGFSDPKYLCRLMKKKRGYSPRSLKK